MCPEGVSVLPLTETENIMLLGLVLLLFSPWFGFYSHHLSVACLKASLVSKGRDERRMTWLCSLPKHAFWDTNQGMSVRERKLPAEAWRASAESLSWLPSFLPFSSHHLSPAWCEGSPLCVWLPLSVWRCVCLCVAWVGLLPLSVWCCSLPRCVLPIMNLSKQSVKITNTFKSFITEQILIISYCFSFSYSLWRFKGPLKRWIFVFYSDQLLKC